MPDTGEFKRQAALAAVEDVQSGMIVGLGHGSTAIHALRAIADQLCSGALRDVLGIPCSRQVEADARELGIPLTTLEDHPIIDLTIDGADEVDPQLNLVKGGGGALLKEKIVAQATRREVIVVDDTKLCPVLGRCTSVPVEVTPFGWRTQATFIESLGGRPELRMQDDTPSTTDQGNYILDCDFGPIQDPEWLATALKSRAGIVEHGLFIGLVAEVIAAGPGGVRRFQREEQQQ